VTARGSIERKGKPSRRYDSLFLLPTLQGESKKDVLLSERGETQANRRNAEEGKKEYSSTSSIFRAKGISSSGREASGGSGQERIHKGTGRGRPSGKVPQKKKQPQF